MKYNEIILLSKFVCVCVLHFYVNTCVGIYVSACVCVCPQIYTRAISLDVVLSIAILFVFPFVCD